MSQLNVYCRQIATTCLIKHYSYVICYLVLMEYNEASRKTIYNYDEYGANSRSNVTKL